MNVYWLEQTETEVPRENDWLSTNEAAFLAALRFPLRSASWRLGRWTAKHAVAVCLNLPQSPPQLVKIEVRPAPSGAPEVFFENKPAPLTISLSHRGGRAICAVALDRADLGCDLELIEPRSDRFIADYFAPEEQRLIAHSAPASQPLILALLWSAKESALKALHEGLRLDTRSVIVDLLDPSTDVNGWRPFQACYTEGKIFFGWQQVSDRFVRTVLSAPPSGSPICLNINRQFSEETLHKPDARGSDEFAVQKTHGYSHGLPQ